MLFHYNLYVTGKRATTPSTISGYFNLILSRLIIVIIRNYTALGARFALSHFYVVFFHQRYAGVGSSFILPVTLEVGKRERVESYIRRLRIGIREHRWLTPY